MQTGGLSKKMKSEYFHAVGGKQHGPISLEELRTLATRGELKRTDKVWKEGMPSWQPASMVNDLFVGLPPDLIPEPAKCERPPPPETSNAVPTAARLREDSSPPLFLKTERGI